MSRGVRNFAAIFCFAAAGCQAGPGAITVRALPNPGANLDSLADARAQLALGNSGLALEGFRKVLRAQPDNAEAYAGIAKSYEAMGRFDLARKNYEIALAFAPKNPALLSGFAVAAAAAQPSRPAPDAMREDEATPTEVAFLVPREIPAVQVTSDPIAKTLSQDEAARALAAAGPSITMALPPPRPASPLTEAAARQAAVAAAFQAGPRLERMSPGEVALVTTGKPVWKAAVVAQSRTSTTVRWIPMTRMASRPNIRVLNAARRQGLAAQGRALLLQRGWRKIEIGDALAARDDSMVIYPAARRSLARSLAAQFGLSSLVRGKDDVLIVVLGRDAARRAPAQTRG
jgi:tetratricopeptide (TPR) repeat protein